MRLEWRKLEKHQPTFTNREKDQLQAMRSYRGGTEYAALDLLMASEKLKKILQTIDYVD